MTLLDNLKNAYNLEMSVFIDEASLREFARGVDAEHLQRPESRR